MSAPVNFLREYFKDTDGSVCLCVYRNRDSKQPHGEIDRLCTRHPIEIEKFIAEHDLPEREGGIYFAGATLKPGATQRNGESCHQFPSIFADVDDKNHELSRDLALSLLEQAELPPSVIVNSGHGLQAHWLLSEPSDDAGRIVAAREKIQALTASDKVHDAPRVMRLPGTHNSKNGQWLEAKIVSNRPEYRYALETLEDWLNRATTIIPRKVAEPKPEQQHNGATASPIRHQRHRPHS